MKTHGGKRKGAGRRPSPQGARVMIPWRVSPRLVERLRWQAAKQGLQPSELLSSIIDRNAPPV
jgi:predicted DNA binding CopG/RHH family protein